jgi:hypothetical protein
LAETYLQSKTLRQLYRMNDCNFSFQKIWIFSEFQSWDSPKLKFCYLFLWLALSQWNTLLEEKTVIVELGESQPKCLSNPHWPPWDVSVFRVLTLFPMFSVTLWSRHFFKNAIQDYRAGVKTGKIVKSSWLFNCSGRSQKATRLDKQVLLYNTGSVLVSWYNK